MKLISNKKEKEISALEKLLEEKDNFIKNLEQKTVATIVVSSEIFSVLHINGRLNVN